MLWNDTRSAAAAADLISDLGGGEAGQQAWAEAVGLVPVASFTVTKLRSGRCGVAASRPNLGAD